MGAAEPGTAAPVIVIGAGISGLVTAVELKRLGVEVTVVERDAIAGGVVRSTREAGFLFESGPNTIASRSQVIPDLLTALGCPASELLEANREAKRRYIYAKGKLRGVGPNPLSLFRSGILSKKAILRLFAEPLMPKSANDADESLAAFVERRLGPEVLRYLVGPFVSGVYAGDPHALSVKATFPILGELEQRGGSLFVGGLRSAIGKKRSTEPRAPHRMLSFPDGLSQLIDLLVQNLGDRVQLNQPVSSITASNGTPRVVLGDQEMPARAIVLATPARVSAQLLQSANPALADTLAAVDSPPLAVVHLGYRRDQVGHPLDGFGFLAARGEGMRTLGCLFSSTLFPHRAPERHVALTAFIGGALDRGVSDLDASQLGDCVIGELSRVLQITGDPVYRNIIRYDHAIPQYTVGHGERLATMTRHLSRTPSLFLAGNFVAGPSLEQRVVRGLELAREIARER